MSKCYHSGWYWTLEPSKSPEQLGFEAFTYIVIESDIGVKTFLISKIAEIQPMTSSLSYSVIQKYLRILFPNAFYVSPYVSRVLQNFYG